MVLLAVIGFLGVVGIVAGILNRAINETADVGRRWNPIPAVVGAEPSVSFDDFLRTAKKRLVLFKEERDGSKVYRVEFEYSGKFFFVWAWRARDGGLNMDDNVFCPTDRTVYSRSGRPPMPYQAA
jgi:hypothetical protein